MGIWLGRYYPERNRLRRWRSNLASASRWWSRCGRGNVQFFIFWSRLSILCPYSLISPFYNYISNVRIDALKDHAYDCALGVEYLLRLRIVILPSYRFTVLEDDVGLIIIGIVVSFIINLLSVMLPAVKTKVTNMLFASEKKNSLLVT